MFGLIIDAGTTNVRVSLLDEQHQVLDVVRGDGGVRNTAIDGDNHRLCETIRDGSYPIASEFYAVTCAPIGSPAPEVSNPYLSSFLDWILSEEGQFLVEKTGYVGIAP